MTEVLFSCDPRETIQDLCSAGELAPFEGLPTGSLSNVDWADPRLGQQLLPCHADVGTDQASRRPALQRVIAGWIESVAGPLFRHNVLDLFCGRGTLPHECAARGVLAYCGVDINPVVVAAACKGGPKEALFHCCDAARFVESSDMRGFTIIFLLYECLNGLGRSAATSLLRQLERRCAPGTWIFGDIRAGAHFHGLKYQTTSLCPYLGDRTSDLVIREYGYTDDLMFFGNRYVGVRKRPPRIDSVHLMLELYPLPEFDGMVASAGLQLIATERLLDGCVTDVPECSSNVFFAARTRGVLG